MSLAIVFPGQGSQVHGMGRELCRSFPGFSASMKECDRILAAELEGSLLEVLHGTEDGRLDQTVWTQPALFAFEYSLARLLMGWGVQPAALLGHSVGEYVAACLAGVFSLESGLRLIARRARLMQGMPTGGGMAAVFADSERVGRTLEKWHDTISIAAINGPGNTVISGQIQAVRAALDHFQKAGIGGVELKVSHAFHSQWMEPMLGSFEKFAGEISFSKPSRELALISNLSGTRAGEELASSGYWVRQLREPVRFAAGMNALRSMGCTVFVEIGPKPVLTGMGKRSLPDSAAWDWIPAIQPGMGESDSVATALARCFADLGWVRRAHGGCEWKM